MEFWLPVIWSVVIAIAVIMYVVLDGFDLGIGILFPFAEHDQDRDIMMNSVAPIWDGNETWLVLGGGGLMAVFPVAYATILPALYLPIIVMLLALVFRGVAFEFRFKAAPRNRWWWNLAFAGGSTLAAFAQGVTLGAFIQGFQIQDNQFVGGPFDWLSAFALLTGFGLVAGYALLGATWLIMKTEGALQDWTYERTVPLMSVVLLFVLAVSAWTPFLENTIHQRWFSWPNIALLSPVPIVTALVLFQLWRAVNLRREIQPFVLSIALFLLCYLGLGISLYPTVVPHTVTVWEAASETSSLIFMLVGVAILLPIILAYTAYTYWVFRGKVQPGEGYH
ncbi:cytochrome d ubiquinol oxidase subunit II [Ferruginivarius sediminum]|uniref:Cytochrome d ubiquinol oxidase subunit II n=1 Tax=Ferruginivarius sediminum TaxID=2661937 RepID=A0A369TCH8_9PROT|nr:cytochrome d ubiquinol oxidase subunit II [Ferruginivarius sediminum]RDD63051.1 cytochrome d ubiquinol oxidase subunit II [Ferruginivarius sediminum]